MFWNRAKADKSENMGREEKTKGIFQSQICNSSSCPCKYKYTYIDKCADMHRQWRGRRRKKGQGRKGGCTSSAMWSFWQNQIGISVNQHRLGSSLPPHPPFTPWTSPLGSGISPDTLTHTTQPGHARLTCTVTLLSSFTLIISEWKINMWTCDKSIKVVYSKVESQRCFFLNKFKI